MEHTPAPSNHVPLFVSFAHSNAREAQMSFCGATACRGQARRLLAIPAFTESHLGDQSFAWAVIDPGGNITEADYYQSCLHCAGCGVLTWAPGPGECDLHGRRCIAHQNSSCPPFYEGCQFYDVECPGVALEFTSPAAWTAHQMRRFRGKDFDDDTWRRFLGAMSTDQMLYGYVSGRRVLERLGWNI